MAKATKKALAGRIKKLEMLAAETPDSSWTKKKVDKGFPPAWEKKLEDGTYLELWSFPKNQWQLLHLPRQNAIDKAFRTALYKSLAEVMKHVEKGYLGKFK
jgi:hypothetical protein